MIMKMILIWGRRRKRMSMMIVMLMSLLSIMSIIITLRFSSTILNVCYVDAGAFDNVNHNKF